MKGYIHNYLDIREVAKHNNLDVEKVMDAVSNSDVSFGTNGDTLISKETLRNILWHEDIIEGDLDYGVFTEDYWLISLGS